MFSKLEVLLCLKEGKLVYPILGVAGRLAKLCARFETRQEHATFSLYFEQNSNTLENGAMYEMEALWYRFDGLVALLFPRSACRAFFVRQITSERRKDQYGEQRCAPDQLTSNLCQAYCCRGELDQVGQPT